jgi:hypothetical protein
VQGPFFLLKKGMRHAISFFKKSLFHFLSEKKNQSQFKKKSRENSHFFHSRAWTEKKKRAMIEEL